MLSKRERDELREESERDFSGEVHLSRFRLLRYVLLGVGTVSLVLGTVGVFLPILPTTPFLLLTAACYARGSSRFYSWLMNNRYFGAYIRSWRYDKRIPKGVKLWAITAITVTIGSSIWFFIPLLVAKVITGGIGIAVILYISRFPS